MGSDNRAPIQLPIQIASEEIERVHVVIDAVFRDFFEQEVAGAVLLEGFLVARHHE